MYNPYQLVGRGEEKSLTLELSIKFLLVLTNATGGDRCVGVGLPMQQVVIGALVLASNDR